MRRVSLVVMSECDWGVKPARVMLWRQMAIVMASGLLVKTEQLLQHRRVPRQYLVMPVTLPTVRLKEQTMHLSCVGSNEACIVVIGLWRWRVEKGAHQLLLAWTVQVWPRVSKDPQLKHEGGGGVGMWLCFLSVVERHGAHRGVGVGRSCHVLAAVASVQCAHFAAVGVLSGAALR